MYSKGKLMNVSNHAGDNLPDVDLGAEVETRLLQFVNDKGAFSTNTWINMVSTMRIWGVFAKQHDYPWFPAKPEHIREWINSMDADGLAATTIKARINSLSILYKHTGFDSPVADQLVRRGLRIVNREHVLDGEKQGQAIPFRRADLEALAGVWGDSPRLSELRDLAYMGVAYNTMLRVAEVARIRVRDVRFNQAGAIIEVGHTKTSLTSTGIVKSLSPTVANYVRRWIEVAGLADKRDSMLFCRVHRVNKAIPTEKPMTNPNTIAIFERAWIALDKPYEEANKGRYETWTGHSARVGAAQDLLEAGVPIEQIMLEGNWSSPDMVLHYLRHALAGKSNLTRLLS